MEEGLINRLKRFILIENMILLTNGMINVSTIINRESLT